MAVELPDGIDLNTLEERDSAIGRQLEKAIGQRGSFQEQVEKTRLTLEEQSRQQEGLLDSFFSRAFPDLPDVVANVLNHLSSGQGCLVCGTEPKKTTKFRELANKGICPFCETKNVRTEQIGALSARAEKEIKQLDAKIDSTRKALATLITALNSIQDQVLQLMNVRAENSSRLQEVRGEIQQIEATLPVPQDELDERRKELDTEARQMRKMKLDIEEKTIRYSQLLNDGKKTIERLASKLTQRFTYYAGEFLAEKCNLAYREQKRRLGEEGELLSYPNFHVEMTSAVSPSLGTARMENSQVSESQKEFVDLAFRMALFDAVRQPDDGVMLVIETPEASLDTVFVKRAGSLLRKFAEEKTVRPNVVVASCNLNNAGMVRSLIGVDALPKASIKTEVSSKIINLLELAAPNAAIRQYGKLYRDEFENSLKKI